MSYFLTICGLTLVLILSIEGSCVDIGQKSRCYSNRLSDPVRFYGTKTTYSVAKEALESSLPLNDIPTIPNDCQPIMLYFVGRHAIRYPDGEDITEMSPILSRLKQHIISASDKGLTEICEQDLHSIRNWELKMNETDDNRISDTGVIETQRIAKRFKDRYPSLLNANKAKIEIGITNKERTEQTANAFIQAIQLNQGSESDSDEEDDSSSSDSSSEDFLPKHLKKSDRITKSERPFLYFHDMCKELLSEQGVKLEKPRLVRELRKSVKVQQMIARVNQRIGADSDYSVDSKVLRHIVRACYFEFAIHEQRSGWCSLLSDEELKLLEYLDDIEDYHEDAYGRDINSKQTCPLIEDLYKNVKHSVQQSNEKKSYLHFTHAGVMKRLYSGLGLFDSLSDDSNAKSDQSICLNDDRKWKSSLVCPFGANFAAVLYKCAKHNDRAKRDDKKYGNYKLLTLVQERPVLIKGCDSYFCSVNKFMNSYRNMAHKCNLQEICRI